MSKITVFLADLKSCKLALSKLTLNESFICLKLTVKFF